jgi:hypothetical protein
MLRTKRAALLLSLGKTALPKSFASRRIDSAEMQYVNV